MPVEPEPFAALFNKPTVDALSALTPRDFKRFVAYVVRRAGYQVREVGPHLLTGVDLEIRLPGSTRLVAGLVCKRAAPGGLAPASVVKSVRSASDVDRAGTLPFVVTAGDFTVGAYQLAETGVRRVYLMNGTQLARYITYVRQSRSEDDDGADARLAPPLSPEYFAGRESVRPRRTGDARILAIANNKGGVGKTTTVYYLGAELATRHKKRVLLIDLDGQGNLTERCLPERVDRRTVEGEPFPTVTQYFAGQRTLLDLITPTDIDRVSILPADPFLTLRDYGGSGRPDVELRFAHDLHRLCTREIEPLGGPPEWILIDTPPAMSVFTRAGLCAAAYVLAPVRPRPSSLAGTRNMLQTLKTCNALMGTEAHFLGGVITHWDNLELSNNVVMHSLGPHLIGNGGRILEPRIPVDNQLEILQPGTANNGARAYSALAEEVLAYAQ